MVKQVYIVYPRNWDRVKVGYWCGSYEKLRSRYVTSYGDDLTIICYSCDAPNFLERWFFKHFEGSE